MKIENFLPTIAKETLHEEIFIGLTNTQKRISSRFFYDTRGSELFGEITRLEEYYPTRTEMGILKEIAPGLHKHLKGKSLVELGSGDASKISLLFAAIPSEDLSSMRYYPVDVSESALLATAKTLKGNFPGLSVNGIVADFVSHMDKVVVDSPKIICFFGSTLGNFTYHTAVQILHSIHGLMNSGDQLLLGLDRVKDEAVLHAAYNDQDGVTAAFNLNILSHVNSIVGSNFDPASFEHQAFYNPDQERIEMHLISKKEQLIDAPSFDYPIQIKKGERIHTENSHKYSLDRIHGLIKTSRFKLEEIYSDDQEWFSLLRLSV